VKDVRVENVKYGQAVVTSNSNLPVVVSEGAPPPTYATGDKAVRAKFQITPEVLEPGMRADFDADDTANPHVRYEWLFGDGTTATGQHVRHRYTDALGTELDGGGPNGAGRFRVLLHVEDKQGHQDWAGQDLVVVGHWNDGAGGLTAKNAIDGQPVAQTGPPFGEVCGSQINAVRDAIGTIGLRSGKHLLRLEALESMSPSSPRLQWAGPGFSLAEVPPNAFSHRNVASVNARPAKNISTLVP
jgi:hypothetical protein